MRLRINTTEIHPIYAESVLENSPCVGMYWKIPLDMLEMYKERRWKILLSLQRQDSSVKVGKVWKVPRGYWNVLKCPLSLQKNSPDIHDIRQNFVSVSLIVKRPPHKVDSTVHGMVWRPTYGVDM
jgi:hypothetical protein